MPYLYKAKVKMKVYNLHNEFIKSYNDEVLIKTENKKTYHEAIQMFDEYFKVRNNTAIHSDVILKFERGKIYIKEIHELTYWNYIDGDFLMEF